MFRESHLKKYYDKKNEDKLTTATENTKNQVNVHSENKAKHDSSYTCII